MESKHESTQRDGKSVDYYQLLRDRPSYGSKTEIERYRMRFDEDRKTQILTPSEQEQACQDLKSREAMEHAERARILLGRAAIQGMGLNDHSSSSVDWNFYRGISRILRKSKVLTIYAFPKVHVYKFAKVHILPPVQLLGNNQQYVPLSPHEARTIGCPYEAMVLLDVCEWVLVPPRGYVHPNKTGPAKLSDRYALPEGWKQWPIQSKHVHSRKPFHKIGLLTMSWMDRRTIGTLLPHNFAYEDKFDFGGSYMTAGSMVHMPSHETLAHNQMFGFVTAPPSTPEDEGYETPDLKEPFAIREAKAVAGMTMHMNKAHRMEIRCLHPTRHHHSTSTIIVNLSKKSKKNTSNTRPILVKMQFLTVQLIPSILFQALGFNLAEATSLMKAVAGPHWYPKAYDPILQAMKQSHPLEAGTSCEDAYLYIANKQKEPEERKKLTDAQKIEFGRKFLNTEFFPQIGLSVDSHPRKAIYFAKVIVELLKMACGFARPDSKDHFVNQRFDTNGILWSSLERQLVHKLGVMADRVLRTTLQNQAPINFRQIFPEQKFTEIQQSCLTRGIWTTNKNQTGSARKGVTVQAKGVNALNNIAGARRSNTAAKANRRNYKSKQIDETQHGRLCSTETPEGEMCGNARFQAVGSTISTPSSSKVLLGLLKEWLQPTDWCMIDFEYSNPKTARRFPYLLEIDGHLIWRCKSGASVVNTIRELRRMGMISPHVGCGMDNECIKVRTSPGRNLRLLIVLKNWFAWLREQQKNPSQKGEGSTVFDLSLKTALNLGLIEYVDAMEERGLAIAFSYDRFLEMSQGPNKEIFSHMEVDPSWQLGVTAGMLPQPHKNPAARSVLADAMIKQTFSGVPNNYRLHSVTHALEHPMRPIFQTRLVDDLQMYGFCNGAHILMSVMMTNSNIEDAWTMNHDANERGLFRTSLLRRYVCAIKASTATNPQSHNGNVQWVDRFEKPDKSCIKKQDANYDKLREDGQLGLGTMCESDDVIQGRTRQMINPNGLASNPEPKSDYSMTVREERGVVQAVRTVYTEGGMIVREVILRTQCLNEVGDKYFTRHGQKGTVGMNLKERDAHQSIVTGLSTGCCMNSCTLLSRMTTAHITEKLYTSACAFVGEFFDATAFPSQAQKDKTIDVVAVLMAYGMHRMGLERHINGQTGRLMQEPLFTGMIYMAPLVHLVGSKIHARDRGPVKPENMQPDDGRARYGGLRFGQMELDAMIANGAIHALLDRIKKSDAFYLPVCWTCGFIAEANRAGYKNCRVCKTGKMVDMLHISYSNKLLFQQFMSMHIWPKLIRDDAPTLSQQTTMENMVVKNYYQYSLIPQPESWEYYKHGIVPTLNLAQKIRHMNAMAKEKMAQEAERAAAQAKVIKTTLKKETESKKRKQTTQSSSQPFSQPSSSSIKLSNPLAAPIASPHRKRQMLQSPSTLLFKQHLGTKP